MARAPGRVTYIPPLSRFETRQGLITQEIPWFMTKRSDACLILLSCCQLTWCTNKDILLLSFQTKDIMVTFELGSGLHHSDVAEISEVSVANADSPARTKLTVGPAKLSAAGAEMLELSPMLGTIREEGKLGHSD